MTSGIILTIFGGILAIFSYFFAPFVTLVEDGVTVCAWQLSTGVGALALAVLAVALAGWMLRSRKQAAGWGLAALAIGQLALLAVTYTRVWTLVPARALGVAADTQTGGLLDGTLVMLDWGFAIAAGQAAGALFAALLIVLAHREFAKNQRFLKLTVQWDGQTVVERVLFQARPVTVGEADNALIQLAAGGLQNHLLLQPLRRERYAVQVPDFVKGQLHVSGARIDASGQAAELAPGDAGVLFFDNDVSLIFGFVGAESATLTAGLGRDPGMTVALATTTAATLVLLLVLLSGQKVRHKTDDDENLAHKQVETIAFQLTERDPMEPDPPTDPAEKTENAPPAPIGPPEDHRRPKVAQPDRVGPTTIAKSEVPKGPLDVRKQGVAGVLANAEVGSALEKILRGDGGPKASDSPLNVSGDDGSTVVGGPGNNPLGFKDGDKGGGGKDFWAISGLEPATDPSGRDLRSTIATGHKPKRPVASVVVASGQTIGGCDKGDVAKNVRARASMVRACYETQLLKSPALAGKLTVQWTIAGDGSVQGEKAVADSVNSSDVTDCVLRSIRRVRFQQPEAGTCVIQWPFVFHPG